MNLVKIVMEVAKKLKGLEDDLLVADLLNLQLVEVVDRDVQKSPPGDIVVQEGVRVGINGIVQPCENR